MSEPAMKPDSLLSDVEEILKRRFSKEEADKRRAPSTARPVAASERMDQLVLPDEMRAKMPLTADRYLIQDNPHLVAWEREARKFLRKLTPTRRHRVSAVMIYEWATGIRVAELMAEGGSASPDLRKINKVLTYYFGRSYMTWIAGKKVARAYNVPPGFYIRRHRPCTLTLYSEYLEGSLYP